MSHSDRDLDPEFILVLITAPSTEIAQKIATMLVEDGLAACVNLATPVHSIYMWQGEMNNDSEVLLIVKSRAAIFKDRLLPAVRAIHPYQVPEIIAIPILMGAPDYIHWMDETIQKQD